MQKLWVLTFYTSILSAAPVSAGLYFTETDFFWPPQSAERSLWPLSESHDNFFAQQTQLLAPPFRNKLSERIKALERKEGSGLLGTEDRINLSAYYLLRGDPGDDTQAFGILRRQKRPHFLLLANQAVLHHRRQEWRQAMDSLNQALRKWPEIYAGWSPERLRFYRRVELFYMNLLASRFGEQRSRGDKPEFDNLFAGVSFEDDQGNLVLGGMARRSRDKLPPDAIAIVRQMMIWLPWDNRLGWLYAMLLNANGHLAAAEKMMSKLSFSSGYPSRKLRHYHRVIREAVRLRQKHFTTDAQQSLLLALAPHGPFTAGPGEPLARAAVAVKAKELLTPTAPTISQGGIAPPTPPPADDGSFQLSDFRWLGWGFLGGLIIGALVIFQVQEIRRRRKK